MEQVEKVWLPQRRVGQDETEGRVEQGVELDELEVAKGVMEEPVELGVGLDVEGEPCQGPCRVK